MVFGVIERPILVFQRMGVFVGQHDVTNLGRERLQLLRGRLLCVVCGSNRKRRDAHFLGIAVVKASGLAYQEFRVNGLEVGLGREHVQPGKKFFITAELGAREFLIQLMVRHGAQLLF